MRMVIMLCYSIITKYEMHVLYHNHGLIFSITGGCLMFTPNRCVHVILATFILHNIYRGDSLELDNEGDEVMINGQEGDAENDDRCNEGDDSEEGKHVRNKLIRTCFA